MTDWMSSRMRSNRAMSQSSQFLVRTSRVPGLKRETRGTGHRGARLQSDGLSGKRESFLAEVIEQDAGQVTFPVAGQNGDDQFACVLGPRGDLESGDNGCSGADADKKAFFERQAARHGHGFVVGDLNNFIDELGIEDAGDETCADALNLVGTGFAAAEHGTVGGLHGDSLEAGLAGLDELRSEER